jgi:hypothetical protein
MDNVKKFWTAIGAQEPHYGVLTDTRFRKKNLPENADDFFASGRAGNFQGCRVIGKHPMNSSGSSFEDYMFVLRRASDRKNVL